MFDPDLETLAPPSAKPFAMGFAVVAGLVLVVIAALGPVTPSSNAPTDPVATLDDKPRPRDIQRSRAIAADTPPAPPSQGHDVPAHTQPPNRASVGPDTAHSAPNHGLRRRSPAAPR